MVNSARILVAGATGCRRSALVTALSAAARGVAVTSRIRGGAGASDICGDLRDETSVTGGRTGLDALVEVHRG